ncbi:hypothetical protein [Bacillus sp. SD088]|uniref:hypothetical protein n=1 Tax=Bacillus sp. SD088 TaxID=2782012 RepID=UPI001A965CDA|nr:hypothetical protein [Bacillus sp. SD088]MBO0994575.1 hypothetical protein [Bacillus sp. SD088]
MEFLFNSKGKHIANYVNGQLHSPRGKNIGHYIQEDKIFIDMSGKYLGEIVYNDRLMYQRNSPYKNINYGIYGNYGNVGNYGNPGNRGSIGNVSGYDDINIVD